MEWHVRMLARFLNTKFLSAVTKIATKTEYFDSVRAKREFEALIPDDEMLEQLNTLLQQFNSVNEVTDYLQREDLTLFDAYRAIRELITDLKDPVWTACIETYCNHDYITVPGTSDFTKAVCVYLENPANLTELSEAQIASLNAFKKLDEIVVLEDHGVSPAKQEDGIKKRLMKKQKIHHHEMESRKRNESSVIYSGLKAISPTSNICERLFSKAGLIFTDLRRSMHPPTLEMVLFLNVNYNLWNERTVDLAIKRSKNKENTIEE